MADDSKLVSGLKDGLDLTKQLNKESGEVADNAERTARAYSGMKTGGGSSNYQGGNQRSSSTPISSGGNPYATMGSDAANQYTGMQEVPTPKFRNQSSMADILKLIGGVGAAALGALPSPNEALYTALMGERLRFYGAKSARGNTLTSLYGESGSFNLQQAFSTMGSPTSALDAVYAANSGAGMGLLPGLNNFSRGLSGFGGVLGGAALASNLNPGLGLVGGMGVMGAMNQARRVNMLKMIGVSVRDIGSAEMNNLPDIIAKLYRILSQAAGHNPTANEIAVSAQSGNALDSLLNQYFDDPNLKQTVISGLMQMANTGGQHLSYSGRMKQLIGTGGSTISVGSLAQTDTQELRMIQSFTDATTKGTVRANQLLQTMYGGMMTAAAAGTINEKDSLFGFLGSGPSTMASALAMAETIGGARGGAGQLLISGILQAAQGLGSNSLLGKLGLTAGAGAAVLYGDEYFSGKLGPSFGGSYTPNKQYTYLQEPAAGSIFNLNIASPTDPYSTADAVSRAVRSSLTFTSRNF